MSQGVVGNAADLVAITVCGGVCKRACVRARGHCMSTCTCSLLTGMLSVVCQPSQHHSACLTKSCAATVRLFQPTQSLFPLVVATESFNKKKRT